MKAGKPSMTAYKVALNLVTLGAKPGMDAVLPPGLVDSTRELLVASGAARERAVRAADSPRMVAVYEAFDWMMPGQFEAFGRRKAFCETQVRAAIEDGATRVLVLGAGYDTLGWRLAPEFPGVTFFEIDHPATARLKAAGVEAMGRRDNLCLLAEDLAERRLVDVLQANEAWHDRERTVIVAEGLVMYLPPGAVQDMFRQCSDVVAEGSRMVFSYIPSGADGRPDLGRCSRFILWLQKVLGEPLTWSTRPEALGPFLAEQGWTISPAEAGSSEKRGVEFYVVAVN